FQALNLSNAFFPNDKSKKTGSVNELWKNFKSDYNKYAQQTNSKLKAETILSLLQKYAVTIPNPTKVHKEVSWYDYTKMKAGLAVCIHDYLEATQKTIIEDNENPLLIIRADISGIQDFISNIASKNASKNLKGRSFYVQLLVNTVLKLMLKKLNLFEGNVMYASGGNFFVIAPNTEEIRNKFQEFEKEITTAIFAEHKTRIAVVMGYTEVSEKQIFNVVEKFEEKDKKDIEHGIDEAIKVLFENVIDKKKKQKFSTIIRDTIIDTNGADGYDRFFNENFGDNGGIQILDAITGEEITTKFGYEIKGSTPNRVLIKDVNSEQDIVKKATHSQIILGKNLKDLEYLVVSSENLKLSQASDYIFNPCNLGIYYYLIIRGGKTRTKIETALKEIQNYEVITLNAPNIKDGDYEVVFSNIHDSTIENPTFTFYGGNDVPTFESNGYTEDIYNEKTEEPQPYKKGDLKDFSHLSLKFLKDKDGNFEYNGTEPKTGSFKRLGVLKMDVDGLGEIFKNFVPYPNYINEENKGEKRPNLSFSYYTALSRNLDWFFKGYLNTIWQNEKFGKDEECLKNYSQIIYSGGDDLFIVGRWDAITRFAELIKDKFKAFTGAEHLTSIQQVTISGGVSIVTDKFPIMKAADFASEAEHKAKGHDLSELRTPLKIEDFIYRKDSFNLFGKSLHWESEYVLVHDLKEKLVIIVGDGNDKIPRSFLGKIQMHATNAAKYQKDKLKYDRDLKRKKANKLRPKDKVLIAPTPRWVWTVIYDFSQMANSLKRNVRLSKQVTNIQDEVQTSSKEFIQKLSKSIFTNSWVNQKEVKSKYLFLELLGIAARWAELEIRSNRKN
ncbi:MAG: hypothetical protein AB8G11_13860, partial [Saprospiraceae bacterium]